MLCITLVYSFFLYVSTTIFNIAIVNNISASLKVLMFYGKIKFIIEFYQVFHNLQNIFILDNLFS